MSRGPSLLVVECPTCGASEGAPCVGPIEIDPARGIHEARAVATLRDRRTILRALGHSGWDDVPPDDDIDPEQRAYAAKLRRDVQTLEAIRGTIDQWDHLRVLVAFTEATEHSEDDDEDSEG